MAYTVLLASVPDDEVIAFREGRSESVTSDLSARCSHILPYWIYPKFHALKEALRDAVDGGEKLRPDLWHPLRAPMWHPAASASQLEPRLRDAWQSTLEQEARSPNPNDWYEIEISKVLKVFAHAASAHNGVVSCLAPPFDSERAHRVRIPVVEEHPAEPFIGGP